MNSIIEDIDLNNFPEHKPKNRIKLSYNWLDVHIENLLDGGCSYGYGTKYLAQKSENTYGIDVNPIHISVAGKRYKHINFRQGVLENTDFNSEFFDAIVLNDVLEHTNDKVKTLNEMYRILKPGGMIIISTPHKGLFAFLDPYNYGFNIRKYMPWFYKGLFKFIRLIKEGKIPEKYNPEHAQKHEHYTLKDYYTLLNSSGFNGHFEVKKIFRSGLLIEVLEMNLESILNIFLPQKLSRKLLTPLSFLSEIDYWIPYGIFAYNIAVKIKKV